VAAMRDLETRHEIGGKKFLLQVETSYEAADYMKYEEIRNEIWKDPLDSFACARNMAAENYFNEGSSLFIAAYVEDESGGFTKDKEHLAGFSYGFVGIKDKEVGFRDLENIEFYSQYTGVKEDYQNIGLGILIKEFQKKILVEVFGVFTVTCTFDPLTGINAHRNIHRFKMDVVNYLENCSFDFYTMLRETDVSDNRVRDIPVAWRFKTREVFQDLFRRGYTIFDFRYIQKEGRKRDFYVLSA
jgi:predicted GNAT superfamily acetyltransferase